MLDKTAIWEKVRRREISQHAAAKLLGLSVSAVNKRLMKEGARPVDQKPKVSPPPATSGPAPAFVPFTANVPPPKTLDEVDGRGAPPPFVPTPANDPAPPPKPIEVEAKPFDPQAAKTGKAVFMKIDGWLVRCLLRYTAGVNPADPEIQAMLPQDMAKAADDDEPLLKTILDQNPEKTAKVGGIFRGWLGLGLGIVFRAFDILGTINTIRERQQASAARHPTPEETKANTPPPAPADAPKGFDLGAALREASEGK